MPIRVVDAEREHRKRDLRLRIGRLRRRIDRRSHRAKHEARRLTSWRTYVKRYPSNAVTAALGVGLALSAGLSARRLSRWLGMRLIRRAIAGTMTQLKRELVQVWADSAPDDHRPEADGVDHGRA